MANYKFVNADQLDSDLTQIGNAIRAKGGLTEPLAFPAEMVSAIEAISTGVELNFDVAAYATEEELQAAAPKEHTIGVITTTEITGWIFDANRPEDLTEGMVWIPAGTSSDVAFNALQENGIQIYPLSAKQYINGELKNVSALIYYAGEWVQFSSEWNGELYEIGNQYVDITGGWGISGWSVYDQLTKEPIIDDLGITLVTGGGTPIAGIGKKIDLSGFSTVYVTVEEFESIDVCYVAVRDSKENVAIYEDYIAGSVLAKSDLKNTGEIPLDVSSINEAYVVLVAYDLTPDKKIRVSKIRME